KDTTQFFMGNYYYTNHRITDFMYQTYCNPAPLNSLVPKLVIVDKGNYGREYYKWMFNNKIYQLQSPESKLR
ncbi:hypothetical protein BDQ12DRAFT_599541, partial [Crucibulum laeve]